jgi:hypothetical protein
VRSRQPGLQARAQPRTHAAARHGRRPGCAWHMGVQAALPDLGCSGTAGGRGHAAFASGPHALAPHDALALRRRAANGRPCTPCRATCQPPTHTPRYLCLLRYAGARAPACNRHPRSLDAVNERRQGLISRLKLSEKEREGLEGRATEAQQFLDKQAEMVESKVQANHVFIAKLKVCVCVWGVRRHLRLRVPPVASRALGRGRRPVAGAHSSPAAVRLIVMMVSGCLSALRAC